MNLLRLYRDVRGNALVEFTALLPLFMATAVGIVWAGLLLWAQVGLQHGVELAARCASVSDIAVAEGLAPVQHPTHCYNSTGDAAANQASVATYAANNSWGLKPPVADFNVSVQAASGSAPACNLVKVTYPFTAMTYLFSITLKAQSCYPTS